MMSSMYSGVSGLRTHQKKMDVIGNNIANVNTLGYKKGQVTFTEVFSQTIQGGGSPQGGKGGTNPQQVGLGAQLGSINTIHTQGAVQRTDSPTDLMIDGEGYFIVSDDESFDNRYYTRAGNFALDKDGHIVTPDGMKVLGYENGELKPLKINKTETVAPVASSQIGVLGNLDSRLPDADTDNDSVIDNEDGIYHTDTTIKDSLGNQYKVNFKFEKSDGNTWKLTVSDLESLNGGDPVTPNPAIGTIDVEFGPNGEIISTTQFDINFGDGTNEPAYFGTGPDVADNKITVDLSQITQYANENDAKGFDGGKDGGTEGASSGILTGFSIDTFGGITGTFSNGMNKGLGQIALAKFDNNSGLEKIGNNLFKGSPNSGEPQLSTAGSSGLGAIKSGSLEMSNVDLSMEFTEMITTQRGFQANSRIITTSDEMLQELVNLKR
ncbi:flagellar hook protein FlgE [Clostridium sp. D2Q-11]|uniref:Flagellar hook protein FlgE n=1 Tax=Anaeromonas frigoriresistens TaxID=2683708 RepID=A0A942UXE1_9FIRM|nr:flagellar hook protein FlgE [Anaeromonas frigoriresistens]MBS4539850.1 flagellar hook protein FlgE [Anaeromonas frigoriresistens]